MGGGLLGFLSRRDLLDFLDLAMQSARAGIPPEAGGVVFDLALPVGTVLDCLRRGRPNGSSAFGPAAAAAVAASQVVSAAGEDGSKAQAPSQGASFVFEGHLSLKHVP